ncbi:matrixin family metalloprotease [Patescibacteria group bacterium]|nr:matrixin family metalloprotease [Patescibacteria group bacterium]
MKKTFVITILLAVLFFSGIALVQAKPDKQNPASDIERGAFVHYPHAKGQAKGAGATGDQVNDFKYSGIHWGDANPEVPYWINPADTTLNTDDVISAVQSAFDEWMKWETAADDNNEISFVYKETTDKETTANPSRDSLNTVSFEPLSSVYPNAIAVTFYWYYRGSKELVETDTVFNSDFQWAVNADSDIADSGKYDLQNIATHEFGHWLLLGDLYSPRDWALTMYGYGYLGETIKSTLGKGDISGINKIY